MLKKLKYILFQQGLTRYLKFKFNYDFELIGQRISKFSFQGKKVKMLVDASNGFIDEHIYKYGVYELDVLKRLVKILEKDSIVVDIGANIGQHSLIFSLYSKHVFSFEPIPRVFNQFSESIKLNNIKNITAYNFAVSDRAESKTIYLNDINMGRSTLLKNDENKNNNNVEVKLVPLSAQLKDVKKVDFVKIDVEGYEPNVILGNKDFFLKHKPTIFVEITPYDYKDEKFTFVDLFSFIQSAGYSILSFNTNRIIDTITDVDLLNQDNWLLEIKR